MFRVVVQESRLTPTSGKVVALLGSYDPHAKKVTLDKAKAATFLTNGAQPSDRVARMLKAEGVDLPSWVKLPESKTGKIRNPEKLRRNQVKEDSKEEVKEEPKAEEPEAPEAEAPAKEVAPEASTEAPEAAEKPEEA